MINKIIWSIQRKNEIKEKDKHRRTTKDILDKRNSIHTALLEADRKETGKTALYSHWVSALDWVLGVTE